MHVNDGVSCTPHSLAHASHTVSLKQCCTMENSRLSLGNASLQNPWYLAKFDFLLNGLALNVPCFRSGQANKSDATIEPWFLALSNSRLVGKLSVRVACGRGDEGKHNSRDVISRRLTQGKSQEEEAHVGSTEKRVKNVAFDLDSFGPS